MVRRRSDEIEEAKKVITSVIRDVDDATDLRQINGGRGFYTDTVDVVVTKENLIAFVVVTSEAWTNAKTDPTEMKAAFRQVLSMLKPTPGYVYLITTDGLKKRKLREEPGDLNDRKAWEPYEDEAAVTEGDKIAKGFLGRLRRG